MYAIRYTGRLRHVSDLYVRSLVLAFWACNSISVMVTIVRLLSLLVALVAVERTLAKRVLARKYVFMSCRTAADLSKHLGDPHGAALSNENVNMQRRITISSRE